MSHMGPGTSRMLSQYVIEQHSLLTQSGSNTEAGPGAYVFMGELFKDFFTETGGAPCNWLSRETGFCGTCV